MSFTSPSWRSINPLKGSRFHHPSHGGLSVLQVTALLQQDLSMVKLQSEVKSGISKHQSGQEMLLFARKLPWTKVNPDSFLSGSGENEEVIWSSHWVGTVLRFGDVMLRTSIMIRTPVGTASAGLKHLRQSRGESREGTEAQDPHGQMRSGISILGSISMTMSGKLDTWDDWTLFVIVAANDSYLETVSQPSISVCVRLLYSCCYSTHTCWIMVNFLPRQACVGLILMWCGEDQMRQIQKELGIEKDSTRNAVILVFWTTRDSAEFWMTWVHPFIMIANQHVYCWFMNIITLNSVALQCRNNSSPMIHYLWCTYTRTHTHTH